MNLKSNISTRSIVASLIVLTSSCSQNEQLQATATTAYSNAYIIDGRGGEPIVKGTLVVENGKLVAVGPSNEISVPNGATTVDLAGKFIIPGMINAHGHVGNVKGLEKGVWSRENTIAQLKLYAKYGITTVVSLGSDQPEAKFIRDEQSNPTLDRARFFYAGNIIIANTPESAKQMVNDMVAIDADFIKIKVDDNLGTVQKMSIGVAEAAIKEAHKYNLPVAAHIWYLDDAKKLLKNGLDIVGHSVRDQAVDKEFIDLIKEKNGTYIPTLVREVSTYVYQEIPEFFSDPFFLREADPQVLDQLKDPTRMKTIWANKNTQIYKQALKIAQANLKTLSDNGVRIAFGTDSGPPARFQGYYEHLELELMEQAGMSPMKILVSATGAAAENMGLKNIGTLEPGNWADFVVLRENPLDSILNSRTIENVIVAGNEIDR
ncbi:MAG: amidohydrolase family protein [Opitutaceae bacterium]|nr:amidohydrolase family protein [Opitutaceae bacterium]